MILRHHFPRNVGSGAFFIIKKNTGDRKKMLDMIVTTGDIKEDYEIIGPVYFKYPTRGYLAVRSAD